MVSHPCASAAPATHDLSQEAQFGRLDASDLGPLLELEGQCFSLPWKEEQFQLAFSQQVFHVFGLKCAGRLVAYLSFYHTADEMEILNLAVAPDRRRRGYAKRLLGLVLQISRKMGIDQGYLEVRRTNAAARALYDHAGFAEVGVRKGYYTDTGEDALIMRYDFTNTPSA